jgi:hypothetical protein
MSELFQVDVLEKADTRILLKVTIVNPEQEAIYEQKNFALQLLWRYADYNAKNTAKLYKLMDEKKMLDKQWIFANDYKLIKSSKIVSTSNYPLETSIKQLDDEKWTAFWQQKENLPCANLEIVVTDKELLSHLDVGDSWLSRAIDYDHA